MAKFHGIVGYVETQETKPGVFEEVSTKRIYNGDIVRKSRRTESSEQLNDNIAISIQISIIADEYAYKHFSSIRFIQYMNSFWKVTDIEVNHPRLILSIGGIYNERETDNT
jgi:hypothetical protein